MADLHLNRPDYEFCGFCEHHADSHDYFAANTEVPCRECEGGVCPREVVHAISDGSPTTSCCGKTPFELPRADRVTTTPDEATCPAGHADRGGAQ